MTGGRYPWPADRRQPTASSCCSLTSRHSPRSFSMARAACSTRSAERDRDRASAVARSRAIRSSRSAVDRGREARCRRNRPGTRIPKIAVPTAGKPADNKTNQCSSARRPLRRDDQRDDRHDDRGDQGGDEQSRCRPLQAGGRARRPGAPLCSVVSDLAWRSRGRLIACASASRPAPGRSARGTAHRPPHAGRIPVDPAPRDRVGRAARRVGGLAMPSSFRLRIGRNRSASWR